MTTWLYTLNLYLLTGEFEDTNVDSDDSVTVVVAVLSVLLAMTIICIVFLVIWIVKLNMKIAKTKKK